jgi:hypothetical protein
MEAVNIANNFEKAYEEYERESLLLPRSVMPEEILQPVNDPLRSLSAYNDWTLALR